MDDVEAVRALGQSLVQSFTEELQGVTTLERETKAAQKRIDAEKEATQLARVRSLYEEQDDNSS
jgi:hypothetical protein